jgi:hypothetical protein
VKGDRVELVAAIPGHPELQPGKQGIVLLAVDEFQATGRTIIGAPPRVGG